MFVIAPHTYPRAPGRAYRARRPIHPRAEHDETESPSRSFMLRGSLKAAVSKVACRVYPTFALNIPFSGKPEIGCAPPFLEAALRASPG